ncbi:MAG: hypothetical protein ABEK50_17215 [bacterium]
MYATLFRIQYWEIGSRFFKLITYLAITGWTLSFLMLDPSQAHHWIQWSLLLLLIILGLGHVLCIKRAHHDRRAVVYWIGWTVFIWTILALAVWPPAEQFVRYYTGPELRFFHLLLSAGILGSIINAMICGHWYLVNKYLSLEPIRSISQTLTGVLLTKIVLVSISLGWIYVSHPFQFRTLTAYFPLLFWTRLIAGLAFGLLLNWMSWKCLDYENTQASTGILYAAITFIIMGEFSGFYLTVHSGIAL